MSDAPCDEAPSRPSLAGRALLYARTARHLRPGQVLDQLRRRLLPRRGVAPLPAAAALRAGAGPATPFLAPPAPPPRPATLEFLHVARAIPTDGPDWVAADLPKLWRYNLHYFDYLHWPGLGDAEKARLVEDWIARVVPGAVDAWEPYPVSLRIVNWLQWFGARPPATVPADWLRSLAQQVATLEGDLERHLLANHLLKNAKALAIAGLLLEAAGRERWLALGLDVLAAEADEQFLADGGHFERSPMYHALCLQDLLDVLNCAGAEPALAGDTRLARIHAAATRAAAFLAETRHADGEVPLLNDAAFGIAPPAVVLLDYAARVLGAPVPGAADATSRIHRPDTGLFGYRTGGESLVVDCGAVGPDYQPGHAHCDTLSFELCLDGRRVIVDSGVHDYEDGPLRRYLRSTAAHNTVRIDGVEQSETWGAFRVARRARPLGARLEAFADGALCFTGAHDGYRRLPGHVVHEREILARPGVSWTVTDRLLGAGTHSAESYLHLAPGLQADPPAEGRVVVREGSRPVLVVTVPGARGIRREAGWYCPEFGKKLRNIVLIIDWKGRIPGEFGYSLERPA